MLAVANLRQDRRCGALCCAAMSGTPPSPLMPRRPQPPGSVSSFWSSFLGIMSHFLNWGNAALEIMKMHHIGECLSKTQTRHILNWASVRSSSVACSTSSCVRLKILAKLLNASNILFIFLIFASISMGWLMLILVLVSLTCSVLHLQSPVHLHRRGTQCSAVQCSAVQWCRSLAGGTTWQRSRSPAHRGGRRGRGT